MTSNHDNYRPKRYTLVALCFCAAFICYIDRINISVAAIAMQDAFGWTDTVKGFVLSSFFVGYLGMQVAGGWLAHRIGGKLVLGVAVIWWSVFTILTPPAAMLTFSMLIVVRIAMGFGEAATFPAVYALFAKWVPERERSRTVTLLLSGAPLGVVCALFSSGWIVENMGWPASFYLFGAVGFIWAVVWVLKAYENPGDHPHISPSELELLQNQQPVKGQHFQVPWKKLVTQSAIVALVVNHFCVNWSSYMLMSWLPSYFRDAHGVSITAAGVYSAAPWLTSFVMMNVAGWIADTLLNKGVSLIVVRKSMQTVGLLGAALSLLLTSQADSAPEAMLLMCAALGMLAFTYSGFAPNTLEIAPKYAGILAGISNTVATLPGIIGIVITGWLVDMTGSYSSALALAAVLNILGAIVWIFLARAEPVID
jgi:ACS family sodium-dependent inorganic phosphate cotransporter